MGVPHFSLSSPSLAITIFIFLIFSFPSACSSLSFEVENNFRLFGDAQFTKDSITLTQEYNHLQPPPVPSFPTKGVGNGRALYKHPIRLLDRATNKTASFLCRFSFSITTSPAYPCGDGLAFLMTSNATSVNNASSFGLPIREKGSKESFFAVEFDTSFDPNLGDVNDNHIGVDLGTVVSFASVGVDHMGINLKNGRLITAWIQYEGDTKMLHVWVSHSPEVKPRDPVISTNIDLLKTEFEEFMYVGFSASNRPYASSRHLVQSWQFTSFGLVSPEIGHHGCSLCFQTHETFTVHGAFSHGQPIEQPSKINKAAAAVVGAAALIIFTIVLFLDWRRIFGLGPREFSVDQISRPTKNFRKSIGKGGAAEIFEGSLDLGQSGRQTIPTGDTSVDSFQRERRPMEARLTHGNIVRGIGWCHQGDVRALVFEFMAKGSLARVLHGTNTDQQEFLSWPCRRKIVLGVASALTYLHKESRLQLLHRDITSPNVLLTKNFKAKLGDFGLTEFKPRGENINAERSSIPSGTPGYISKDLILTNIPTVKTDVYSFGVLALQVATGLLPIGNPQPLRDLVWQHSASGELTELADKRLNGAFEEDQMRTMIIVGMLCTQDEPKARPTMGDVKAILEGGKTCPEKPDPVPVNPAPLASITE